MDGSRRLAPSLLALALAAPLSGCTAVVFLESSALVCANGVDDDGNGMTDCDDPGCDASGVCESTMLACTNGVDDDGDGLTDCEERACREGRYCDSFVTDCTVYPQSGCPAGMGCYVSSRGGTVTETRCRSAGAGRLGSRCTFTEIEALTVSDAHPCAAGYACNASSDVGLCGAYCRTEADCPTGGLCGNGACTTPCDPRVASDCGAGLACVSLHERGDSFDAGGARWACADAALARGLADVGAPCRDAPDAVVPGEQICRSSLACVPELGGATFTCRRLCNALAPDCPGGGRCERLYPMGSPSGVGMTVFGVCY